MDEKKCIKCRKIKSIKDYYVCKGYTRNKCKTCVIKQVTKYQKSSKKWQTRTIDKEKARAYMQAYYQKNKAKFFEHFKKFKEKNPDYYKQYARNKKLKPV